MTVSITVDDAAWNAVPGLEELASRACEAALAESDTQGEVALLFTGDDEIAALNQQWRGKSGPTNVLSFPAPADLPVPEGERQPLGDMVLAFGTVAREAQEQGKTIAAHTTHLIVHGCLHLLGYDHLTDLQAEEMEALEISLLAHLGFANPYLESHERH